MLKKTISGATPVYRGVTFGVWFFAVEQGYLRECLPCSFAVVSFRACLFLGTSIGDGTLIYAATRRSFSCGFS